MKRSTFVFAIDPPIHAMIEGSLFSEDEHTALLKSRGSICAKCSVKKMNRAAEQSHLELSQLHDSFPILESLCGASIGADKTLSFVRELLEMALVTPEAPYPENTSNSAADSNAMYRF
jgi:hypothetical protein